ncbi:MAG TPA: PAS domain S-box protein [Terriglobales bacterium]
MWKQIASRLALVWFLAVLPGVSAHALTVKNILVLHEGWEKWPSNTLANTQIQETFAGEKSFETQLFQEYVDESRLVSNINSMGEALRQKYSKQKFDLIIAVGSTPLKLLLNRKANLFPGVPVVFMIVSKGELPAHGLPANMTGVTMHPDFTSTVNLALRLHPGATNLVLISGSADLDRFYAKTARDDLAGFAGRLQFTYLDDLPLGAILSRTSQLPDNTIILYVTVFRDGAGHSYIPSQAGSLISVGANAPVYGFFQTYMGRGIVGGNIVSVEKQAKEAAQMGLEILEGQKISNLPVRDGPPGEFQVDWRQLQRWRIPESRLPPGTSVLYTEPGVWESYRWYIIGAAVLVALQALLIAALFLQIRKRLLADREVQRRLQFETLISETSARFINLPAERIPAQIEGGLDRVRTFLNVDRVTLYDRTEPEMEFRALHYAPLEGSGLLFPSLTEKQFPWAMNEIKGGKALLVEDLDQLPKEASIERAVARQGVCSFAVIPLQADQALLGLLVLATTGRQRGWSQDLARQLQILGDIFYQAALRQRAEEAARESERRFALVADSAPMLVWMAGTDKRCTYFNKGWLDFTGRSLEQEMGDGWVTGVHPEDIARCMNLYSQAFDDHEEFKLEYRLLRHDGEYRWIMDCGLPRYTPDGSFCGYIGSCIDITDLKRSQQELEELSGRLIHAQEEERKRVARELHDNFGQRLTVLSMELAQRLAAPQTPEQVSDCLHDISEKLKEISRAMNSTAHQLHSSHLEVLGLVSAVQGLCDEFSRQYGIQASFAHDTVPARVPSDVALCLFRIVQEGLQNVAKHSGALSCEVTLHEACQGIRLAIKDPGIGFDPARLKLKPGLGFISMRERLRMVGGEMNVESSPSRGTEISVRVPYASMTTAA